MHLQPSYFGPGAVPREPTEALPGSEQKIRIMTERAARRQQLFHPLDGIPARLRRQVLSLPVISSWPVELSANLFFQEPAFETATDDFDDEPFEELDPAAPTIL
jgi:hypothetical protein